MTMAVFEIRLPMMGSRPTTKVSATRIFTSGRSTPNRRSTTSRYSHVKKVLIIEIQNCANTTRWNAVARRAACRTMCSVSGRRSCGFARLLHREQRADDHAHEHVDQRAADAAPGELQRARVRSQPFGDRAPQRLRVFGHIGLQVRPAGWRARLR